MPLFQPTKRPPAKFEAHTENNCLIVVPILPTEIKLQENDFFYLTITFPSGGITVENANF